MIIKEGYNGKPLHIRIGGRDTGTAEVWLEQEGLLPDNPELIKYRETLSYATIEEVFELKKECEQALKDMLGLK